VISCLGSDAEDTHHIESTAIWQDATDNRLRSLVHCPEAPGVQAGTTGVDNAIKRKGSSMSTGLLSFHSYIHQGHLDSCLCRHPWLLGCQNWPSVHIVDVVPAQQLQLVLVRGVEGSVDIVVVTERGQYQLRSARSMSWSQLTAHHGHYIQSRQPVHPDRTRSHGSRRRCTRRQP